MASIEKQIHNLKINKASQSSNINNTNITKSNTNKGFPIIVDVYAIFILLLLYFYFCCYFCVVFFPVTSVKVIGLFR